jgi:hypothetical protein
MNTESIYQRARSMLGDISAVKFSDMQLETALSLVLAELNSRVPHVVTLQFEAAIVDQVLALPENFAARNVLSVECLDFDPPLNMAFHFDENLAEQVVLIDGLQNGVLNCRVKIVSGHQIEGLDGADFSTISNHCEMLLASGTAAHALKIRSTQLAESANQEPVQYQAVQQNMRIFEDQYLRMLSAWQSAQPVLHPPLPVGPGWQLD